MSQKREPQPQLKLESQETPHQKISISRMPISVYDPLNERANSLQKRVPNYCRIVLEHAVDHKEDYEGPLAHKYPENPCYHRAIHIPIVNKEFMNQLLEWDPFGQRQRTKIALSILRKHLETRKW